MGESKRKKSMFADRRVPLTGARQIETDAFMRALSTGIDDILNPGHDKGVPRTIGFMLVVAPMGQPEGDVRTNYVANVMRPDAMEMLTNLLDRWKAKPIAMQNPDHSKDAPI